MKFKHTLLCASAAALLFSCKPKSTDAKSETTTKEVIVKNTAENTVKSFRQAILDGKGEQLWNQLPTSYQKDVNFVVQDFATTLDPAIYKQSVDILTSLNSTLKAKKSILVEFAIEKAKTMNPEVKAEDVTKRFEVASKVLDSIVTSDFKDLEALKKTDLKDFFKNTVSTLLTLATDAEKASNDPKMAQAFAALKSTGIKVLSESDLETVLEMTLPAHGETAAKTEKVTFTKVEDKWLPQDMAKDWKTEIAKIKENITKMKTPEAMQKQKQAGMFLMMAKGFTDQLAAIKTKEDLTTLVNSLPIPGLGAAPQGMPMPPKGM